ncbi:Hermansky-Pudlak syndrome 5 protein-like [Pomacea canaliculata]|uniref:Hermansky-Pudlak syndrome 5 protein-like n=1 Tax=Pomacea canaliculata TaxID=400727 RepID=UPI000D73E22C|nr:Hermansky-Pudlak syndrome 5 protein-like [Pomacea canaliculata]XP_025087277.1 Hermansky-Pudlak syndrome 5 protein-like [Pomacea canaliculata]
MALSQSQVPLTHLFAELSSLEDLRFPLERSSRLQYTCLSVSQRYIALGSNTGGVYIFSRESLKYLQVVFGDVEVSAVTATALSPNDQNVALADSSGQVIVMELNIERRIRPERVRQTTDHVGATVTAMLWDNSSSSLFVADSLGKVTLINVSASKAKTLFTIPSETIVRLDSSVYQMDWWSNKLLVSTVSRTYLLNNTRHQFSQIGQKSRDGKFGACFFIEPSSNYAVIYCARPGSRMWEVDFEGNVLNTHQFKQSLATHPSPIISQSVNLEEALLSPSSAPQSVNFQKMFRLGEFILTWSSHGFYVFDPVNVKVVLWMDAFKGGISDMCVVKNEVYIFLESQEVRRLVFLPIFLLVLSTYQPTRCTLAARLLLYMENFALRPSLLKRIKKELVPQLTSLLITEGHLALAEKISGMLEDVSVSSGDLDITQEERVNYPQYSTQLSGIVVVNDGSITSQEKGLYGGVSHLSISHKKEEQNQNSKVRTGKKYSNGKHPTQIPHLILLEHTYYRSTIL